MASPAIVSSYPNNLDTGIPVGISIEILFDAGVDIDTVKNNVVVYGPDSDQTSGPDTIVWTSNATINQSQFLSSPGFTGIVPCDFSVEYWDLDNDVALDPGVITGQADESTPDVGHKLYVTPRNSLAADTTYYVYVIGDPDSLGKGVSARTVFDVEEDVGNTSTTGVVEVYGGYTSTSDTVVVEITTSGDINTAKYRWYYDSDGVPGAVSGKVTSKNYRKLDDGLLIKFDGSGFVSGDIYRFNVEAPERLADNFQFSFATNDGSYELPPDSPSTPATSSPPSTILETTDTTGLLEILKITPENRAYNVSVGTDEIVIEFSDTLDEDTLTDESVVLIKSPISKDSCNSQASVILQRTLTVSGNVLTIRF